MPVRIVTQKDIAKRLSISRSHVAGVLSGNPRATASADMRHLIAKTAREMGYVPQAAGQMLRRGQSNTISFAYVKNDYLPVQLWHASAIETAAEFLSEYGYDLKVKAYSDNKAILNWLPKMAGSRSADAGILWGFESEVEAQGALLESLGFPFVAYGNFEATHPGWIQAVDDHTGMIRVAVEKLVSLGHERIAFLGHGQDLGYAQNHCEGFHAAIAELLNRDTPREWILLHNETADSHARIQQQVATWARMPESRRPTALAYIQGGSFLRAFELTLLQHGISIGHAPGQFDVAGPSSESLLLVGRGWQFRNDTHDGLISRMVRDQLIPLVRNGQPKQQIVRYLPDLVPGESSIVNGWNLGIPTPIALDEDNKLR